MVIYSEKIASDYPLFIYSLKPINRKKILTTIGNKARNLVRLFKLGYHIPSSIFVDYTFFETYHQNTSVVKYLVDKIVDEFHEDRLALRSSCDVEDSGSKSLAGIFKTILNIENNSSTLSRAMAECFQLYLSPQFIELIKEKKLGFKQFRIGLIIQHMISPKISGILFTHCPLNPTNNCYQIEYCSGTGDKLTGGFLTGNLLNLDKSNGKIVLQRGNIFLSRSNIQALFHIAKTLETKLSFPQDLEFVISDKNELFLLQSRPITAFNFAPEFVIQKESAKIEEIFRRNYESYADYPILSDTNITELFPSAVPLGYSIFKTIFAGTREHEGGINVGRSRLGYAKIDSDERTKLFVSVGNQARVNLFIDALTFRLEGLDKRLYIDTVVKLSMNLLRENSQLASYPEFSLYLQADDKRDWISFLGEAGHEFYKTHSLFLSRLKSTKIPEALAEISHILQKNESFYRKELEVISELHNLAALKQKMIEYLEYLRTEFAPEYVVVARIAFLSAYLVKSKLKRFLNINEKNQPKSNIIDEYFNLLLATNQSCPSHFKMPNQSEFEAKVRSGLLSIKEFLDIFQHLGPLDISQPRLGEYSRVFLHKLLKRHNEKFMRGLRNSKQAYLINQFYCTYQEQNPADFQELNYWIDCANTFMTLRENFKFELLKIIYLIKRMTNKMAKLLDLNDAIYYLELDELLPLNHRSEVLRFKAMQEKAYYDACAHLVVNKVIKYSDERNVLKQTVSAIGLDDEYKSTGGITIHYGKATGLALVARNNQEYYEKLMSYRANGIREIIGFFRGIELSYINLNGLSGIVTENGGYLAHAATIAREYNIPYISNVKIDYFEDGYYIILDTANQQVIYREQALYF